MFCRVWCSGAYLVLALSISSAFAESRDAGRLKIPAGNPTQSVSPGLVNLGGSNGNLYVPSGYQASKPAPLLILLHKSGGNSSEWFWASPKGPHGVFAAYADSAGFVILAPNAPGTWGSGGPKSFGYDAVTVNNALQAAFARCAIDRSRLAIGGFSDGASYALSLGLINGDLFSSIIAFSPGYIVGAPGRSHPELFWAHGGGDAVLPIASTSRVFVAQLRKNGYHIDYREFGGGHRLMPDVAEDAMKWLTARFHR
jgi:phospholipase/carboxylesterase